jgi:hypothetical protein
MAPQWCHDGVMDLRPYIDTLRHDLAVAAEAGGDDARELAERLVAPLESAVQLALLDALSAAADEITTELAPGAVDLRLHGRQPSFVVTLPPAEPPASAPEGPADAPPPEGEEAVTARINFRLTEHLKGRVEAAASRAGLSVNAWLTRAATSALDSGDRPAPAGGHGPFGGQRYNGWVR